MITISTTCWKSEKIYLCRLFLLYNFWGYSSMSFSTMLCGLGFIHVTLIYAHNLILSTGQEGQKTKIAENQKI